MLSFSDIRGRSWPERRRDVEITGKAYKKKKEALGKKGGIATQLGKACAIKSFGKRGGGSRPCIEKKLRGGRYINERKRSLIWGAREKNECPL